MKVSIKMTKNTRLIVQPMAGSIKNSEIDSPDEPRHEVLPWRQGIAFNGALQLSVINFDGWSGTSALGPLMIQVWLYAVPHHNHRR
jgi:hypothetical protein